MSRTFALTLTLANLDAKSKDQDLREAIEDALENSTAGEAIEDALAGADVHCVVDLRLLREI